MNFRNSTSVRKQLAYWDHKSENTCLIGETPLCVKCGGVEGCREECKGGVVEEDGGIWMVGCYLVTHYRPRPFKQSDEEIVPE